MRGKEVLALVNIDVVANVLRYPLRFTLFIKRWVRHTDIMAKVAPATVPATASITLPTIQMNIAS